MSRPSFRTALTGMAVALATLPLLVAAVPLARELERRTAESAERELALAATRAAESLGARLALLVSQATMLGSDSDILRGVKSLLFMNRADTLLQDFLGRHPWLGSVHLLNTDAKVVTAVPMAAGEAGVPADVWRAAPGPKVVYFDDPSFLSSWSSLLTRESRSTRTDPKRTGALAVLVPVPGLVGRVAGTLVMIATAASLEEVAAKAAPSTARVELLWQDEVVAVSGGASSSHVIAAVSQVPSDLAAPLSIRLLEPHDVRFAAVARLRWLLLLAAAFALLLAGAGAWLLARRLFGPVASLTGHLERLAQGGAPVAPPPMRFAELHAFASTISAMESRKAELERAKIQAELDAMRSQMNPHFLFNSLNSIATMVSIDATSAVTMVNRLAALLRGVVDGARRATWPLARELDVVKAYLELEAMRFGDRLTFDVDAQGVGAGVEIPPLVLQTLAENAVKHGIAKSRAGGRIAVVVSREADGGYRAAVENTGAGLAPGASHAIGDSSGAGLANTQHRLSLLYGERSALTLSSTQGATTVASFWFSGAPA